MTHRSLFLCASAAIVATATLAHADTPLAPAGEYVVGRDVEVKSMSSFMTGMGPHLELTLREVSTGRVFTASSPDSASTELLRVALKRGLAARLHVVQERTVRGVPYRARFATSIGKPSSDAPHATRPIRLGRDAEIVGASTFTTGQGYHLELTLRDTKTGQLTRASTVNAQDQATLLSAISEGTPARLQFVPLRARGAVYRSTIRVELELERGASRGSFWPKGTKSPRRELSYKGLWPGGVKERKAAGGTRARAVKGPRSHR